MGLGAWRFAVWMAGLFATATLVVAWVYDLPLHDPDTVGGPTYLRLPAILLLAFLLDVVPRAVVRALAGSPAGARRPLRVGPALCAVVRERWGWAHLRFALVGLAAWYVVYASFRNLKSFVPFVNPSRWDGLLDDLDRLLFAGHDPATLLHQWLGTGVAAHVLSFAYIAWIVLVPASLVVALAWSRDTAATAWYVTAVGLDWVLGVATHLAVPSLGPVYAEPERFADLPRTWVTYFQELLIEERRAVLVNPLTADAVQTVAAFASLHVGIMVTMCVVAELLRLHPALRAGLWAFLALTVVATIYLGWHYFVDAPAGAVVGLASVWLAARATGQPLERRRPAAQPRESAAASRPA